MSRRGFGRNANGPVMPNALRNFDDRGAAFRCVFAHLDADKRPLQRGTGAIPINVGVTCRDAGPSALQSLLGAFNVNLFGKLRRFRQYSHALLENFREPPNNREMHFLFSASTAIAQFSNTELRNQRRVPWQNPEFAFGPGQHSLDHAFAQQLALRCNDDQLDGVGKHLRVYALAFIFSALARASSIVPTM